MAKLNIALCCISTGKYSRYIHPLWDSAYKHFLPDHNRTLFLFGDVRVGIVESRFFQIDHEPWPGPTLHRYRTMLMAKPMLQGFDFMLYVDVDALFNKRVGEEVVGDLVATVHPGFYNKPRESFTYETRPQSKAYVAPHEGKRYYAGGVQGGRPSHFIHAMEAMAAAIEDDEKRGIVAVYHDESHWNRYCIDNPPTVELSPSYCYPESWQIPFDPKLLVLDKDHKAMRS